MKVAIGWVAVNKITNKVNTIYTSIKAAVSKSNNINNFEFFEAFIEV